jgi:hypothetical protein
MLAKWREIATLAAAAAANLQQPTRIHIILYLFHMPLSSLLTFV